MNSYIAVDPYRCTGCDKCREACSEGHRGKGKQAAPRLALVEDGLNAALACHHCEDAPCCKVCPTNAIAQRSDGRVLVDEHACIGCKMCALACPFGAVRMGATGIAGVAGIAQPYFAHPDNVHPLLRWQIGESGVAVKCDLCAGDTGGPLCVKACITSALRLASFEEGNTEAVQKRRRAGLEDMKVFEDLDGGEL